MTVRDRRNVLSHTRVFDRSCPFSTNDVRRQSDTERSPQRRQDPQFAAETDESYSVSAWIYPSGTARRQSWTTTSRLPGIGSSTVG